MEQSKLTDNSRQRQNNFCIFFFFFTVKRNQEQSSLKGVSLYDFIIIFFSTSKGTPTHLKAYPACNLTGYFF